MSDSRTLEVIINGKDNLSKTLGTAQKSVGSFSKYMEASTKASKQLATGIIAAGAAFGTFAFKTVQAANESERAQKRLETLLLNVKGATLAQADALRELAAVQMRKTTLDDDTVIAGQSQLATFQLQAKTIGMLTPALVDLGVAVNGVNVSQDQLQQLGNLVGKAMMGQTSALTRYGVTMNETQQAILKTGTETERAAALVEILNQNFGGLAEGMRNTTEGRIVVMKNQLGELSELIGSYLTPVVDIVTTKIVAFGDKLLGIGEGTEKTFIDNILDKMIELRPEIELVGAALLGGLIPAVIAAGLAFGGFVLAIAPFMALGIGIKLIKDAWDENLGGMQEKVGEFSKAVAGMARKAETDLKILVAAVKIAVFGTFIDMVTAAEFFWERYREQIIDGVEQIIDWGRKVLYHVQVTWFRIEYEVHKFWVHYGEQIITSGILLREWATSALAMIFDFVDKATNWFTNLWEKVSAKAKEFWDKHGEQIKKFSDDVMLFINNSIEWFKKLWEVVREPLGNLLKSIEKMMPPLLELGGHILKGAWEGFKLVADYVKSFALVALPLAIKAIDLIVKSVTKLIEWVNKAIDAWDRMSAKFSDGGEIAVLTPEAAAKAANLKAQGKLFMSSGGIVPGPMSSGDTVSAMLTPGEEVLRRDDPRHSMNGGGSGLTVNVSGPFYGGDDAFAEKVGDYIAMKLRPSLNYVR